MLVAAFRLRACSGLPRLVNVCFVVQLKARGLGSNWTWQIASGSRAIAGWWDLLLCAPLTARKADVLTVDRSKVDLRDQAAVAAWIDANRPDVIILAAAKVGGILANDTYPADFLYDNLAIQSNIIHAAHEAGVERLVFLGSSCIYPKFAPQPIREDALLSGPLEPTNEWYAVAKIAGIKLCQAYKRQFGRHYVSIIPCNLYGPFDNFDLATSHVLPALIRRFHEAKVEARDEVVVWGTGTPLREFLHVDDLAEGVIIVVEKYDGSEPINCGAGFDVTISELAERVCARRGLCRKGDI